MAKKEKFHLVVSKYMLLHCFTMKYFPQLVKFTESVYLSAFSSLFVCLFFNSFLGLIVLFSFNGSETYFITIFGTCQV